MKIPSDVLFTLTPQRDRRQVPDRRMAWRGGRRASDHVCANVLPAHELTMWTSVFNDSRRLAEKPILH